MTDNKFNEFLTYFRVRKSSGLSCVRTGFSRARRRNIVPVVCWVRQGESSKRGLINIIYFCFEQIKCLPSVKWETQNELVFGAASIDPELKSVVLML